MDKNRIISKYGYWRKGDNAIDDNANTVLMVTDRSKEVPSKNKVKYCEIRDTFFVKRCKKNDKNLDGYNDTFMLVDVKTSKNPVVKPNGMIISILADSDEKTAPKPCLEHPSDTNSIFKIYKLDDYSCYKTKDVGWINKNDYSSDSFTLIFDDSAMEKENITMPMKFTCNTICQLDILPQKHLAYKFFNLEFQFFKFNMDGSIKFLEKGVRKIFVGDDPDADMKDDQGLINKWSDKLDTKRRSGEDLGCIPLDMDITIDIPKEAADITGKYFETLMEDTKNALQNIAKEMISKDIQKAIRHKNLMKEEYKNRNQALKNLDMAMKAEITNLNQRCNQLGDELAYLRSKLN